MFFSGKDDAFFGDNSWVNEEVPIEDPVLLIA